jgi:hypothetical protein
MIYDAGEHVKEVFAQFGLAYYLSGVFEAGLVVTLLYLEFLSEQKAEFERKGRKHFDRARFQAELDVFMQRQHAKTLGPLIKRLHDLTGLDDALRDAITSAKTRRNFIAHHFFREHAENFMNRQGRDKMIVELKEAQEIFDTAEKTISDHIVPRMHKSLGIRADVFKERVKDYMESVPRDVPSDDGDPEF